MKSLLGIVLACALSLCVSTTGRADEDLFQECCHRNCCTASCYAPCCPPPACACPSVSFRIGKRCGPIRRLLGRCCLLPCTSCYSPPVVAPCPSCGPPPVNFLPAPAPSSGYAPLPDPSATHNAAPVNPAPPLTPVPPTSMMRPVPPPLTPPLPPPPVRLERLVSFPRD
jgi:hypothetical protein